MIPGRLYVNGEFWKELVFSDNRPRWYMPVSDNGRVCFDRYACTGSVYNDSQITQFENDGRGCYWCSDSSVIVLGSKLVKANRKNNE